MSRKSDPSGLLRTVSCLTDPEWLEVLIKSVEQPAFHGIELPGFPPDDFQRESVGSCGEPTLREAYSFYHEIKQYAVKLGVRLTDDSRVLDFGCGWGRITRFFLKDLNADNLYGIDVDPEMIGFCKELMGYGNYRVVNPLPPTEFADDSFDIVYAYSVFSHLAEDVHIKWVEEFSRILKAGGLLIVTTEPRHFIEYCRSMRDKEHETLWHKSLADAFPDIDAALADYDSGKFVFSGTQCGGPARPSSFYGEAVIPRAYVEQKWTQYLSFKDFVDDRLSQSMIVMQKTSGNYLESLMEQWKDAVAAKDICIRKLEDELREKDAILSEIYASKGWKALSVYRKVKDKVPFIPKKIS